ncbi:MAG: benzoate 1,2-dioxygenase large subunit [Hyphomicrobiales bacterium]|nr:MAG: benzoate 1,2-dioxygenase large subunit [Hyphomicrobiales bacterium]
MSHTPDSIARMVREEDSTFAVARSMFIDLDLFEMEMEHIFEGNWLYICHESQIPKPKDFISAWIGRQPVVINRDAKGVLGGFVNVCAHRGATVCREKRGNRGTFTCPFHGWVYDAGGKLLSIRDEKGAGYPADFDKAARGLTRIPRVESYRGFVFASLRADVLPLTEYLGGTAFFLDLVVDQAPNGIEVLRGSSSYVYNGNWKLQMENGADGYHVASVHSNYVSVLKQRESGASKHGLKTMTPGGVGKRSGGFYAFKYGHVLLWSQRGDPQASPNYPMQDELIRRYGEDRAFWMLGRSRNLGLYPNLFLMDSMSTQIRQFRPTGPATTEVTSYCYAPVGEDAESRIRRLRQFEDFYNATGMATPDDLAEFQGVQEGHRATPFASNDLSRGATHWIEGADELARKAGFSPVMSGPLIEDEGLFVVQHRAWQDHMVRAIRAGKTGPTLAPAA